MTKRATKISPARARNVVWAAGPAFHSINYFESRRRIRSAAAMPQAASAVPGSGTGLGNCFCEIITP